MTQIYLCLSVSHLNDCGIAEIIELYERSSEKVQKIERVVSHGRSLHLVEWEQAYQAAGLALTNAETMEKQMEFTLWAARHDAVMQR